MREMASSTAFRFQYLGRDSGMPAFKVEAYHQHLANAEMLLQRVQAAHDHAGQAIHTRLTSTLVEAAVRRPRQDVSTPGSPEYLRWFEPDGEPRPKALAKEELIDVVKDVHKVPMAVATHLVQHRSDAISQSEIDWLNARARVPLSVRPLDATEYGLLVEAIEEGYRGAVLRQDAVRKNVDVALAAARLIGEVHHEYVRSPFGFDALTSAYQRAHADHLHAVAVAARVREEEAREQARAADPVELAKNERKMAEYAASLADRAAEGIPPKPMALSVRLETSDGREIWWSVMAVDPDGVTQSAVCEAVVDSEAYEHPHSEVGETIRFVVEVHCDDGTTPVSFEGTGDMWRDIEAEDGENEFYRRLLDGESLEDAAQLSRTLPQASMG
ncbi:MAG: hypothetical protein ACREPQ_00535 [Rhodanobacter sp.]